MIFIINNNRYMSLEQRQADILLRAYYTIKNYPMHAAELALDNFIQQQYKISLKNMCIRLLLNLTVHEDSAGSIVLLFKDQKHDRIASLITYGNGIVQGSKILQNALGK